MSLTIALIDDSRVMRSIIRKSIMMSNFEETRFLEASNGSDGLQILIENRDEIDLIITDLHMPGVSGIEMLRMLQSTGHFTNIPIIVISTDINEVTQQQCRQYGVRGFLGKPFSHDDVVGLLTLVLENPIQAN
ncbi:MAG: response regulator [Nitrospinae bacterium]|nr:response regulator [Nitrospinota bacterium]